VFGWGILLGSKLFDLRVLAGAWSASPPESLSLMPYGSTIRSTKNECLALSFEDILTRYLKRRL